MALLRTVAAVKRAYALYPQRTLLVVNTTGCGVLMGLGDVATQIAIEKNKQVDWRRTGRMAIMGVSLGPLFHGWYVFLDKFFPGRSMSTVLKKLVLDQGVACPGFMVLFFAGMGTMEGQPIKETVDEMKCKFLPIIMADCCFWPPMQAINFRYVPPAYRVFYVAVCTLFWDSFLSFVKYKNIDPSGGPFALFSAVFTSSSKESQTEL